MYSKHYKIQFSNYLKDGLIDFYNSLVQTLKKLAYK